MSLVIIYSKMDWGSSLQNMSADHIVIAAIEDLVFGCTFYFRDIGKLFRSAALSSVCLE